MFSSCYSDVDPSDGSSYCDKYGNCSNTVSSRTYTVSSSSHSKSNRPNFYAAFLSDTNQYYNKYSNTWNANNINWYFWSDNESTLPNHSFSSSDDWTYWRKITVSLSQFLTKAYSWCTTNNCILYHSCTSNSVLNNSSITYTTRFLDKERVTSDFWSSWPCTYYAWAAYRWGTKPLYETMIYAKDTVSSSTMKGVLQADYKGTICAISVPIYQNTSGWWTSWWWWGGGGCFLSWTQVITKNGTKNIEDLQKWDSVLSYDIDSGEQSYNEVVNVIRRDVVDEELYELNIENHILKVTWTHRFYIVDVDDWYQCSNVWKRAMDVKKWDILLKQDGSYVIVDGVNHYPYSGMVYNFEVENTHAYYVDEWYLVHNIQVVQEEIIK